MRTLRFVAPAAVAALLALLLGPAPARAQETLDLGLLPFTLYDFGAFSFVDLNRPSIGNRQAALGGSGVALSGDPSSIAWNPAGVAGLKSIGVYSELRSRNGNASGFSAPPKIVVDIPGVGPSEFDLTHYTGKPTGSLSYDFAGIVTPIRFRDRTVGVGGVSYRRIMDLKQKHETRFNLKGQITQGAEAGLGTSAEGDGGVDAITVTLGTDVLNALRFGVNLNFLGGEFRNVVETGVSVFGFRVSEAKFEAKQSVSGFLADAGAQVDLLDSRVTVGGVVNLSGDIDLSSSRFSLLPIGSPDPSAPKPPFIVGQLQSYTLKVPTQFGLGVTAKPIPRVLLSAEYWNRPWSDATITQEKLARNATTGRLEGTGENLEKNAHLASTNSFRAGLEYLLVDNRRVSLPVRFGFRKDDQTFSNFDPTDLSDTDGDAPYQGEQVTGNAVTFGIGIRGGQVSAGIGVEHASYEITRPFSFFPSIPPTPSQYTAKETDSQNRIVISTGLTF